MSSVDSSSSSPTSSAEKLSDKNNNNNHHHHQHNNDIFEQYGVHLDGDDDDQRVCWNSDAPDHPRNWSPSMKAYTTTIICWLELYMTGISSAGVSVRETDFFLLPYLSLRKENHIQLTIDGKSKKSIDRRSRHCTFRIPHQPHTRLLRLCHHLSPRPNHWRNRPGSRIRNLWPSHPLHRRQFPLLHLLHHHSSRTLRRRSIHRKIFPRRSRSDTRDGSVWEFQRHVCRAHEDRDCICVYHGGICGTLVGARVCQLYHGDVWMEMGVLHLGHCFCRVGCSRLWSQGE